MKKLLAVFVISLACGSLLAQPPEYQWSRTFGGSGEDKCQAVIETSDGGYALAGHSYSFGTGMEDFWLVKTNGRGVQEWAKRFGGNNAERCWALQQTTDGGFILAGFTQSFGAGAKDFWLLKTDANGDSIWSRTYGGAVNEWATSVKQTSDGGYVLAGWTQSFGAGDLDMWVVKTNSTGIMEWSQTYGGSGQDEAHVIHELAEGGYLVAGFTFSFGAGQEDFYAVKTAADGTPLWSHTYGGSAPERCWDAIPVSDGGFALVGMTQSYGNGAKDFWLVRTDADGNTLWDRAYGGEVNEWATTVLENGDQELVMAGWTQTFGAGSLDMWAVSTSPSGDFEWSQTYGAAGSDECHGMVESGNGRYVLAGFTTSSGAGGYDFYLVKTRRIHNLVYLPGGADVRDPDRTEPVAGKNENDKTKPLTYSLGAYPNPFNPLATIEFSLPEASAVTLLVTDITGRQVAELADRSFGAGEHQIAFDGSNLPAGVYILRLTANNLELTHKLFLLK